MRKISCRLLSSWLDDGQEIGTCLIWRSLFEEGCCCQVVTQRWVILWWMKAERSDLEGKNLGLMRGRFVAFLDRESIVSLPYIPLWLKIMSCARGASKVWMRETMGRGAWLFDSVVPG